MKMNHLFTSAAIAVVFVATAPANAQLLDGGLRGGLSGVQSTTFGGGYGPTQGAVNDQAAASASGHSAARTNAIGRAGEATTRGANEGMHAGDRAKNDAVTAGQRAAAVGASDASMVGGTANAATQRVAVGTEAAVTTAEQSAVSAGKLRDAFADGVSGHDVLDTSPTSSAPAGDTGAQAMPTTPAGDQSRPKRQPKTSGENGSSAPNANGKISTDDGGEVTGTPRGASASASGSASTTS